MPTLSARINGAIKTSCSHCLWLFKFKLALNITAGLIPTLEIESARLWETPSCEILEQERRQQSSSRRTRSYSCGTWIIKMQTKSSFPIKAEIKRFFFSFRVSDLFDNYGASPYQRRIDMERHSQGKPLSDKEALMSRYCIASRLPIQASFQTKRVRPRKEGIDFERWKNAVSSVSSCWADNSCLGTSEENQCYKTVLQSDPCF